MSQHPLLKEIEGSYRRSDLPELRSGDSVRVHTLIKEGDKERVQVFEGVVIGQHRGGSRATFTVRKSGASCSGTSSRSTSSTKSSLSWLRATARASA